MKHLRKIEVVNFIAILLMIITITSCTNNDIPNTNTNNPIDVINIVNNGTWRITYYYDTDHEETINFNGYNFTFGANNILTDDTKKKLNGSSFGGNLKISKVTADIKYLCSV